MKELNDFPLLKTGVIYFDNAATSLKPKCVIEKVNEYYSEYSANSHRGDYDISFKVDDEVDNTRILVKDFINASKKEEIIFTKNTTESLNMIVFGFFENYLDDYDEVILSKEEHASNILPWQILSLKKNIKIVFLETNDIEELKKKINSKTKVISLAQITNVKGIKRDIKRICKIAHEKNILVVVDAAQSAPHIKIDVQDLNCDFLAFSAHKMLGPTGVGVLYGKYELLTKMIPITYGGGMNKNYSDKELSLERVPYRFEAGTQNLSGIIGFGEAIKYINEKEEGSTVIINMDNILSGDLGLYLNSRGICVRSGKHCAKMIGNDTVRISLYFYNSYEEIDSLISALKDKNAIYDFVK